MNPAELPDMTGWALRTYDTAHSRAWRVNLEPATPGSDVVIGKYRGIIVGLKGTVITYLENPRPWR